MSDTPRTAFPRWLHAVDPSCAEADANGLYTAFRARGAQRSATLASLRYDPLGWLVGALPYIAFVLFIVLMALLPPLCCLWIPLLLFSFVLSNALRGRVVSGYWLPGSVTELFGASVSREVLCELRLTPNSPRDFARAMLYEARAGSHWFAIGVGGVTCAVLLVIYLVLVIANRGALLPGDYVLVAGFLAFMVNVAAALFWYLNISAVGDVQQTLELAAARNRVAHASQRFAIGAIQLVAVAGIGLLGLAAFFAIVFGFYMGLVRPLLELSQNWAKFGNLGRWVGDIAGANGPQVVGALFFLLFALLGWGVSRLLRSHYRTRLTWLDQRADALVPAIFDNVLEGGE
ncbi:MAG: hypothetical protein SF028_15130 [Candidatus Sumerlaeia bacterium]|nr:hypothetical protein [Candidatus Sumerlaeia bacterium]